MSLEEQLKANTEAVKALEEELGNFARALSNTLIDIRSQKSEKEETSEEKEEVKPRKATEKSIEIAKKMGKEGKPLEPSWEANPKLKEAWEEGSEEIEETEEPSGEIEKSRAAEEAGETSDVTIEDIRALAKEKMNEGVSREEVKGVISKFAESISEIDEDDVEKCYFAIKKLKDEDL